MASAGQGIASWENSMRSKSGFSRAEQKTVECLIQFKDLPYNPFRKKLYTVMELMQGYPGKTMDQRIADHYNAHNRNVPDVHEALAQRIHDHAMDKALKKFITPSKSPRKRVVGVMGGHTLLRTDNNYVAVAQVAWELARMGFVIVSGGGAGIMEAASLGAYMSSCTGADLMKAVATLKRCPDFKSDPTASVESARAVRRECSDSGLSLALRTWAYGGEPTGQFSSAIGKYFSNSMREDGLLAVAASGVIFAPGSSGTLQEIFQDVAHNSYWSFGYRSPIVFYSPFYAENPSIFDVARRRADLDGYGDMVGLCSTVEEVTAFILAHSMRRQSAAPPKEEP